MHRNFTVIKKYVSPVILNYLGFITCLFLTAYRPVSTGSPTISWWKSDISIGEPVSPTTRYWGPLRFAVPYDDATATTDPIRFSVQCNKQAVRLDETVELTITAELLTISPALLFFQPGATAYTLKMLLPAGFEQTGGDLIEYISGELSYPNRPLAVYRIRGRFRELATGASFRLLRGQDQSGSQGLFVEKATVRLQGISASKALSLALNTRQPSPNDIILHVITDGNANVSARLAGLDYNGFLDDAGCDTIRGWICNTSNMLQSQEVDIYINEIRVASLPANSSRPDVAKAFNVKNFDQYGFIWAVPALYKSKDSVTISVRPTDTVMELKQSPVRIAPCYSTGIALQPPRPTTAVSTTAVSTTAVSTTAVSMTATSSTAVSTTAVSTTAVSTTAVSTTAVPATYLGFLDYAGCDMVQGWICNSSNFFQSQEVDIYINEVRVASMVANLSRPDVEKAFNVKNFDQYGFKWTIPSLYKSKDALTISVRPSNTATDLKQSPIQTAPCGGTSVALQQPGSTTAISTTAISTTAVSSTASAPSTATTTTESVTAAAQALPSFRRGLVIGNSITLHSPSIDLGWFNRNGMAASKVTEDYVHKIETALKLKNPTFEIMALGTGASLERIYNSLDTSAVGNNITNIRYDITNRYGAEKFDLLILSISENVDNNTFNESKFRSMLDRLIAGLADKLMPGATIIFRNGLWVDHEKADVVLKNYANEKGHKFADMSDLQEKRVNGVLLWPYYAASFQNSGVRRHPNDLGHSVIAARFLSLLLPQSTPTPPASTTNPFTWQVPATESAWDGTNNQAIGYKNIVVGNYLTQENDQLRIELRQGFGGALQIYDKVSKQNLINFFDQGRESGLSSYSGPLNFSNFTSGPDKQAWWNIGYNPVPPGDHGGNASPILFKGKVDGWLYTKAQSISWPHVDKTILPMTYEQWVKVTGNKVEVKVRLVHSRPDKTHYEARSQEWPFVMVNGARVSRFYTGDQPFSFQQSTGTNGIERKSAGGSITHQGTPFYLTEPWMATEIGRNPNGETRLFGMVSPTLYKSNYNVAVPDLGDNFEGGNTMTYLCGQPFDHLDSDKTTYFEYTFVVGTETEVRSVAYSIPRMDKPDFSFTRKNGRAGWYWFDGAQDQKEPFSDDNWKLTFIGKTDNGVTSANNTKIISPAGAWRAALIPVIYVRMRTNTSRNQMALGWALNQQAPDGAYDTQYPNQNQARYPRGQVNNVAQRQVFTVKGDNQWRTYAIPVGNNGNWNGIIQQLEIKHEGSGTVPVNETFEISYIGANNPGN